MKTLGQALLPLILGGLITVVLLPAKPFEQLISLEIRLFTPIQTNEQDQVKVYKNLHFEDVSGGDDPRAALKYLAGFWGQHRENEKICLMGNSQMLSIILAPGEHASKELLKTYLDQVAEFYGNRPDLSIYRLAAPNLSWPEALWYTIYLTTIPGLQPNKLILQINYESFRKTGIRTGMLFLLENPEFRGVVQRYAGNGSAYAGAFQKALEDHNAVGKASASVAQPKNKSMGSEIEEFSRGLMKVVPGWRMRHYTKGDFLTILYLLRVHLLGITPTTPRSLDGQAVTASVQAFDEIGRIADERGIRINLLNAPQNPRAPLWRTRADRQHYLAIVDAFRAKHHAGMVDFENAIPADEWGYWADGPDPIHLGIRGHARLAQLFEASKIIEP
jgi:hypothetical protein